MKNRPLMFAALALCCASIAWAQLPASSRVDLLTLDQVDSRHFNALDTAQLSEEDAFREAMGQPPRFAIVHEAGVTPEQVGTWEQSGDLSIWRYRVQADKAVSLNFGFTGYWLPQGASLYIGSVDGRSVAGPYTADDNETHGQLWTPVIASPDVVIELNVPTALRDQVNLVLGTINQGYRAMGMGATKGYEQSPLDIGGDGKVCKDGSGRSGACNTDVACLSNGDPWNNPRQSVGGVSSGGSIFCTGSLVNNTANDGRMLFMTATHCGVNAGNAASLVVYWNYEWPTCRRPGAGGGTSVNPPDPNITTSGATFLAATRNPFSGCTVPGDCSDVTLVEMDDPANPAFNLYWAGWDRADVGATCANPADPTSTASLCASIHHPNGDEKRITFVDQNLTTANIAGAQGVHWLARWDQTPTQLPNFPAGGTLPPSVTEPGSSGSPLYNASQQFVGVLSGGASFCGAGPGQLTDQYGKLAHAWEGLGTPATRVRDYLDPLGTNPTNIPGRGGAPFALAADPSSLAACAIDGSATVDIDVTADGGFVGSVDLDVSGNPAGTTTGFSPTSVTPPGTSVLTIGSLGSADAGDYSLTITGESGGDSNSVVVPFSLSEAALGATVLTSPADGATGEPDQPTLTWQANGDAVDYLVEVATDEGFTDIVFSATVIDTSVDVDPALDGNTTYYWRVTANNNCGEGTVSDVFSFTVAGADFIFCNGFEEGGDGSCAAPVDPDIVVIDDIDFVPNPDFTGGSVRWLDGTTCNCDTAPFNFNVYGSPTTLQFFWPLNTNPNEGGVTLNGTTYAKLASGATINASSQFLVTTAAAATAPWTTAGTGYIGFKFDNAGTVNYGYAEITTGAAGRPFTIVSVTYNSAGDPITIP